MGNPSALEVWYCTSRTIDELTPQRSAGTEKESSKNVGTRCIIVAPAGVLRNDSVSSYILQRFSFKRNIIIRRDYTNNKDVEDKDWGGRVKTVVDTVMLHTIPSQSKKANTKKPNRAVAKGYVVTGPLLFDPGIGHWSGQSHPGRIETHCPPGQMLNGEWNSNSTIPHYSCHHAGV
jgi:hypothetical protein